MWLCTTPFPERKRTNTIFSRYNHWQFQYWQQFLSNKCTIEAAPIMPMHRPAKELWVHPAVPYKILHCCTIRKWVTIVTFELSNCNFELIEPRKDPAPRPANEKNPFNPNRNCLCSGGVNFVWQAHVNVNPRTTGTSRRKAPMVNKPTSATWSRGSLKYWNNQMQFTNARK